MIYLLVLLTGSAASVGNVGPAGITLYSVVDGKVLLLVADHAGSNRGWAGFGGASNPAETSYQTAARETEEETRGYFKRDRLLQQISGQYPTFSGFYSSYFAEVPFVSIEQLLQETQQVTAGIMREREYYAWIPLQALTPLICAERLPDEPADNSLLVSPEHLPDQLNGEKFWVLWIQNLRDAHQQNNLPWKSMGC